MTALSDRLKKAREDAGFRSGASAAEMMGVKYSTYSAHENGSKNPSRENLTKYANKFKVSLDWLMTGKDSSRSTCRFVPISHTAEAGTWFVAKSQMPQYNEDVGVPDNYAYREDQLFATVIRGDSSDKTNNDGDILVAKKIEKNAIENGKRYIVQRTKGNGQFEITVKRSSLDADGEMWLLQETNNAMHMIPLKLSENEVIDITVLGQVIWDLSAE